MTIDSTHQEKIEFEARKATNAIMISKYADKTERILQDLSLGELDQKGQRDAHILASGHYAVMHFLRYGTTKHNTDAIYHEAKARQLINGEGDNINLKIGNVVYALRAEIAGQLRHERDRIRANMGHLKSLKRGKSH